MIGADVLEWCANGAKPVVSVSHVREQTDVTVQRRLVVTRKGDVVACSGLRGSHPRHRAVHDDLGVDEDIVCQAVTERLPSLIASLEKILRPLSGTKN
jgi:hypothetical protein